MLAICMTLAAIAQDGCYVSQEESISLQPYIVQWCHRICAEGLAGPCRLESTRTDATEPCMQEKDSASDIFNCIPEALN